MAAATSWLCPLTSFTAPTPIRATSLFSPFRTTSFLLTLSLYSKEKGKKYNNFVPKRNLSITARAQWEAGEEEVGRGRNTWQGRGRETDDTTFYVGNLPYNIHSPELLKMFKDVGNPTNVEVIYDRETGRSRGFAFVTMESRAQVYEAVARFNGYEYQGRTLKVRSGTGPKKNNLASSGGLKNVRSGGGGGVDFDPSCQLYVGNLPWGADSYTLQQLFRSFGKVKDARIMYNKETGRSRGFGFVTMSSSEEAEAAISSLDWADMDGRPLRVRTA